MPQHPFDAIDRRMLAFLQHNGRAPNTAVADAVKLSPTASLRRLKALEADGVIARYRADLSRARLGLHLTVFLSVVVDHSASAGKRIEDALSRIEHVVACHVVSGDADYFVELAVPNLLTLERILTDQILAIPEVKEARSTFVIRSIIDRGPLPLSGW